MTSKKKKIEPAEMDRAIADVVDRCLSRPDMPEVGIHLSRLQREGHSLDSAKRMIGSILVTELYLAKKMNRSPNYSKVKADIAILPKIAVSSGGDTVDIRSITKNRA